LLQRGPLVSRYSGTKALQKVSRVHALEADRRKRVHDRGLFKNDFRIDFRVFRQFSPEWITRSSLLLNPSVPCRLHLLDEHELLIQELDNNTVAQIKRVECG
jgi:hypothetical protein